MPTNLLDSLLEFRNNYRIPTDAALGGLLGAAIGGGTTALTKQRAGETRQERRARLLRNAAAGGIMGSGAGAAFGSVPGMWSKLFPPASPTENAAQGLADQFAGDKPLSGWWGSALGMSGAAGLRASLSRQSLLELVADKARDFTGRASQAASEASAEAQRRVNEYKDAIEKSIREHPDRINSEVRSRMESWTKAPEYAAEVQRRLGSQTASQSFIDEVDKAVQAEFAKNPNRALDAVRKEAEQALRAKLETRIMEDLTRTKSQEFLNQVRQAMPAPATPSKTDLQAMLENELRTASKSKLSPLAHELQMDWGKSKVLGRPTSQMRPDKLVEALHSRLQQGNFLNELTPGRYFKPTGYTGVRPKGLNPLMPGAKHLHVLSLLLGGAAPFLIRNTVPAGTRGLEVLENTFQPNR